MSNLNLIPDSTMYEIKNCLENYVKSITTARPNDGRDNYVCPICGSGSGKNGTSAFRLTTDKATGKKIRWECYSGNHHGEKSGDIIKLFEERENIGFKEAIVRIAEMYGITLTKEFLKSCQSDGISYSQTTFEQAFSINDNSVIKEKSNQGAPKQGDLKESNSEHELRIKLSDIIQRAKSNVNKTSYLKERGFTDETISKFNLGYDEGKSEIIIPYNKELTYYCRRPLQLRPKQGKYMVLPTKEYGSEPLYNPYALNQTEEPCFICEGPFDALSIMQAGNINTALALNGTEHQYKLYKALDSLIQQGKRIPRFILCLDNDKPGREAQAEIKAELEKRHLTVREATFSLSAYDNCKDPNEMLIKNPEKLSEDVRRNIKLTKELPEAETTEEPKEQNEQEGTKFEDEFTRIIHSQGSYVLQEDFIDRWAKIDYIPTCFPTLDKELDGGFYPGLYCIGAISSLGKTTFTLQVADQIAKSGKNVLYVSLEMGAGELAAKSLSRITYQEAIRQQLDTRKFSKTVRGIMNFAKTYQDPEVADFLQKSIFKYREEIGGNIFFYEGIGNISVKDIKDRLVIQEHEGFKIDAIFIDYLQILAPDDPKMTDKRAVDFNVMTLKQLSREKNIPIFVISSLNRDNYSNTISLTSFKESGGIEYSTDVLIGLQPKGLKNTDECSSEAKVKDAKRENNLEIQKIKARPEREISLVILKNRNGRTGANISFTYNCLFNNFKDNGYVTKKPDNPEIKKGSPRNSKGKETEEQDDNGILIL